MQEYYTPGESIMQEYYTQQRQSRQGTYNTWGLLSSGFKQPVDNGPRESSQTF